LQTTSRSRRTARSWLGVAGGVNSEDRTLVRYNLDGSLDPSFDGDGKVVTAFTLGGIAIQSDGRIVTAGASGIGFGLARFNPDGSLDPTFDGDGKVETDFGVGAGAGSVAIAADGKIVAAGSAGGDFALARYNADGSIDPSFDGDGTVVTDFDEADAAHEVVIQTDGRIVAAGSSFFTCGCPDFSDSESFVLARYNADGSLDSSFAGDGKVFTGFGGRVQPANGVVIQADGKMVAAGYVCACRGVQGDPPPDFALARYNADGSLDPSFDGDGKVITDFGGNDQAYDVAIQADGKIVAAGERCCGNQIVNQDFALARYNPDGASTRTSTSTAKC